MHAASTVALLVTLATTPLEARIATLEREIDALNRADLSCAADDDCVALPVGYKECGGPWRYLIASEHNPKLAQIRRSLESQLVLQKENSARKGLMSTCDVTPHPWGVCARGQCSASLPVNVEYQVVSLPRVTRPLEVTLRIQSPGELEQLWDQPPVVPIPSVDFGRFELLPWAFCRQEPTGMFMFRLSTIEEVGSRRIASFTKSLACGVKRPSECGYEMAKMAKTSLKLERVVREGPQPCGAK
jgi:hypothetical protein